MKNTIRTALRLAPILALLSLAAPAAILHAQQRQKGGIQVQVDLVHIPAIVVDANGRPVPDLAVGAFSLSENGVAQKIEQFEAQTSRPLDLALMVDSSMSALKELKFEDEAAAHFIRQVVRPGDALAVFEFAENVTQLSEYTDNISALEGAAKRISPGTGTSIYDAIVLSSQTLKRRPADRRRAIVLVTDGGETTSVSKFEETRRAAIASEALLYSIIVRPVKNEGGRNTAGEHAIITITDSTGGALFVLDELSQINDLFDRISRELRTQYLLGYYPTPTPPPNSRRHVDVQVSSGDLVRYRKEYFTAPLPK